VIPTKDRYKYLKHLINFIDGFCTDEIELVIQDNTYNNSEIVEFLNLKDRSHLKYYHNKEQLPISLNTDLAIQHSTGEYVCFIGDDDGVLPNIIDCVKWMKKNGIEALRPAITIYNWPDFLNFGKKNLSGTLLYDNFSNDIKEIDSIRSLQKLAKHGFTHIYSIPKVYQGIVKRICLDKIYNIGGTFSPGPSPDMATAVALSFVVKKFVAINIPVIIIGQSQTVGGGERKLKGGVKNIDEVPFLPKNANMDWNSRIPRVWCSQTVWPESAIKAMQYMNKESEIKTNYEFILAKFIDAHNSKKKMAIQLSENKKLLFFHLLIFKAENVYMAIRWRIKYLIPGKKQNGSRKNIISGINNIKEASNILMNEYKNNRGIGSFNCL
jgi:glycosyltransferase involved in cell wall biosynthesis